MKQQRTIEVSTNDNADTVFVFDYGTPNKVTVTVPYWADPDAAYDFVALAACNLIHDLLQKAGFELDEGLPKFNFNEATVVSTEIEPVDD